MRNTLRALIAMGLGGTALASPVVPTITPHVLWAGSSNIANQAAIDPVDTLPTMDTTLYGDGSWKAPVVANFDVMEMTWVKPDEVITAHAHTNAPDYSGINYVDVWVAGGTPTRIPGSAYGISPRGIPGFQFKIDPGLRYGPVRLNMRAVPYQGRAKTLSIIVFIEPPDGVRKTYYVNSDAPNDSGNGTAASPYKYWGTALSNAQNGSIVLLSGSAIHDISQSRTAQTNSFPFTVRAAPGLTKDQVVIDTSQTFTPGVNGATVTYYPYTISNPVTNVIYAALINFEGLTLKTLKLRTLRAQKNNTITGVSGVRNAILWRDCWLLDDDGYAGPVYDPNNNITDPDEVANPGSGGFCVPPGCDETTLFYTADGCRWGFAECKVVAKHLRGDMFRRNVDIKTSFDANYMSSSGYLGRTEVDGITPKNDNADSFFGNVKINLALATAFKDRFHDVPTVRIASIDQTWPAGTICGTGSTAFPEGAILVTLDTNKRNAANPNAADGPGPTPQFKPYPGVVGDANIGNQDVVSRFLTGGAAFLGLHPGAPPTTGQGAYGYRLAACGLERSVTIGGAQVYVGRQQAIIAAPLSGSTAPVVGDVAIMFTASHTDYWQYGGQPHAGAVAGLGNHTFLNCLSYGPGAGNLIFFQACQNYTPAYMDFGTDGTWQYTASKLMTVAAASTAAVDVNNPPAAFDGYTAQINDKILLKNQSNSLQNTAWFFKGAGVAMVQSTDPQTEGTSWRILNGTQKVFIASMIATYSGSTLTSTSVTLYKFVHNDMVQVRDAGSASNYHHAFIETVAADGLSGTISRPFVDPVAAKASTPVFTPVAISGVLARRSKSISDVACINMAIACDQNYGQFQAGSRNIGFFGSSLGPGLDLRHNNYDCALQLRTDWGYRAFQELVFADTYLGIGLAVTDVNGSAPNAIDMSDPHADCIVTNCASVRSGAVHKRFGGNLANYTAQTAASSTDPSTDPTNSLGLPGASMNITTDPFRLSGVPNRAGKVGADTIRRLHPQLAFDVNNAPRVPGASPIGALAA